MSISNRLRDLTKAPTHELELLLEDVSATAKLFVDASRLRPRLGRLIRWETLEENEQRMISGFLSHKESNENIVPLSFIVMCYGLLEEFVRGLVSRSVISIDKEVDGFSKIPEDLANENVYLTGRALQSVKNPKSYHNFDYRVLGQNLGTCAENGQEYVLNADCFSIDHGVLTADNIEKLFRRIGVNLNWDSFGRNDDLKKLFGLSKTRDCSKKVRDFLDNLTANRNTVAHSGGLDIRMDHSDFEKTVIFITTFCSILVEQVAEQLQKRYG